AINPYVHWALGPGQKHYFRQEPSNRFMPLLLRLKADTALAFLAKVFGPPGRQGGRSQGSFTILAQNAATVWVGAVANPQNQRAIGELASSVEAGWRGLVKPLESVSLGRLVGLPGLRALQALPRAIPVPRPRGRARSALLAANAPTVVMGV